MDAALLEDKVSDSPSPDPTAGRFAPATPLNPRRRGLIIGASDGLGAALARRLAPEGYTLALLARRPDKLDALCREINASAERGCACAYAHDVTEFDQVPDLLRKIV